MTTHSQRLTQHHTVQINAPIVWQDMTHSHLNIHPLTEASAASTTSIQPNIAPIAANIIAARCARRALATNDPRVDHNRHVHFEPVAIISLRQSSDPTGEFVAKGDGQVVSSDPVRLLGRVDSHWTCSCEFCPSAEAKKTLE
jgi:hypothetical protein